MRPAARQLAAGNPHVLPARPPSSAPTHPPPLPTIHQANAGAPSETRRVGAFTVTPDVARRLLKGRIESAERRRAEEQVSAATGFPHVRFVQMAITWLGPAAGDGPRLSPLYLPLFVYSYSHAGVKVRSFVSGVDGRAAGAHYLDDSKLAVLATLATGGALLLSGVAGAMSPTALFGAGLCAWEGAAALHAACAASRQQPPLLAPRAAAGAATHRTTLTPLHPLANDVRSVCHHRALLHIVCHHALLACAAAAVAQRQGPAAAGVVCARRQRRCE